MIKEIAENMQGMLNKGLGFVAEVEEGFEDGSTHAVISLSLAINARPVRFDVFSENDPEISGATKTEAEKAWAEGSVYMKEKNGFPYPMAVMPSDGITSEAIIDLINRMTGNISVGKVTRESPLKIIFT